MASWSSRVPAGEEPEAPALAPATSPTRPANEVLALQASAGNAAVAQLLARQGLPSISPPPIYLPGGSLGPFQTAKPKIVEWIKARRDDLYKRRINGELSMPELINEIRKGVAEAAELPADQVEQVVKETMREEAPPPHRAKATPEGRKSELEAMLANAMSKLPTGGLKLGDDKHGNISIGLGGIKAGKKLGPVELEGKGSLSTEAPKFAVEGKTEDEKVVFEAKLEKDKTTGHWDWEGRLGIAIIGRKPDEALPGQAEITKAVQEGHDAIGEVIEHIERGGSPNDAQVKDLLDKKIKPAIEAVEKATKKPPEEGPTVTLEAKGGHNPELGTYGMLSLVIRFGKR